MAAGPTYRSIASINLTSTASTATFSSIPATYTDLVLVMTPVVDTDSTYPFLQFNSDTGNNYDDIGMYGNPNGGKGGYVRTSNPRGYVSEAVDARSDSNAKTMILVNILDYLNTNKHKFYLAKNLSVDSGTYRGTEVICGRWASTSAITSITIGAATGGVAYSLKSGFKASLYGIERA